MWYILKKLTSGSCFCKGHQLFEKAQLISWWYWAHGAVNTKSPYMSTERTISVVHRFTSVIMILSDHTCLSQQRKTLFDFTPEQRLSVPLDSTNLSQLIEDCDQSIISNVEHHSRRLCFILHGERHKLLLSQTANGRSGRHTRKY